METKRHAIPGTLVACLTALLVLGCGGERKPDPPGYKRHAVTDKGFSIAAPEAWTSRDLGMAFAVLSPPEGGSDPFIENVNVVMEKLGGSLSADAYYEANLKTMGSLTSGFTRHDSGTATIDGKDAKWLLYGHQMQGMEFKVLAYMFTKGSRGYVITCTAKPDTYAAHQAQFEQIVQTFRFE